MDFFDLHCDTPYECFVKRQEFCRNDLAVSGEKGSCFSRWQQCFAFWIRDDAKEPYHLYKTMLAEFRGKLRGAPENLTPLLTVEGGAVLEDQIDRLVTLSDDGIRAMTLTWNGENRIAGGANSHGSLTHFGKQVIARMNDLSIACDLSHLNEKSFYQAIGHAAHPLATHSNCRAVCDHPRNLTDDQLRLLGARGGIVGLCFYPPFLGGDLYEKIYENIVHLCEIGLSDSIACGSDFDGADLPPQLDSIDKIPCLAAFLREKGLPNALLQKIFYKNAEKFFACL